MIAPLFYSGTFISSLGSFAFNVALIAFMLQNGFEFWQATLIIGLNRLVLVVISAAFGHLSDQISPTLLLAVTEGLAFVASIALLLVWNGSSTFYPLFAALCITRGAVVSFQTGSKTKLTKFMSDETFAGNAKHAIWLNKATQGATLFGGLIGWCLVHYFSFKAAIIFDGLTFLINGAIAFNIPEMNIDTKTDSTKITWHQKFRDLFFYNKRAAILDILLAVSMMGTVAFQSRMAGERQDFMGLYMAGFGLAVWVAGFLERGVTSKIKSAPFWVALGVFFFTAGQIGGPGIFAILTMFLKDLCYWIIFHRISAHIQTDTPIGSIGGAVSARATIMVSILASGEILIGAWAGVVPLSVETTLRATVAVMTGIGLLTLGLRKAVLDDRPAL